MLKRLIIPFISFWVTVSPALADMNLQEKEFKAINTYLAFQIKQSADDKSEFVFSNLAEHHLKQISSWTLMSDFRTNFFKAKKQYLNSRWSVHITVVRLEKSSSSLKIIADSDIGGNDEFYAIVNDNFRDVGNTLSIDDRIDLDCKIDLHEDIPFASDCIPVERSMTEAEQQAEKITKAFLAGKNIQNYIAIKGTNKNAAGKLFYYKYAAKYLPDNSPCLSWETFKQCNYNSILPNKGNLNSLNDYLEDYKRSKDFYHLP